MVETRAWQEGSYRELAFAMLPIVSRLVDRAAVKPGERVLDVACGTATVGILAALRGARVTGIDITPRMLDLAREDASMAGVEIELKEGDAQKLPFPDASFDVVVSNMGVIFAPDAEAAASEMVRVLRPGGRLAFTAWAQGGATAALHDALGAATGASGPAPHLRWGDPAFVRARLAGRAEGLAIERDVWERPALSPAHFFEQLRRAAPPVAAALASLPPDGQERLRHALLQAVRPWLRDGLVRSELLRVVAARPSAGTA